MRLRKISMVTSPSVISQICGGESRAQKLRRRHGASVETLCDVYRRTVHLVCNALKELPQRAIRTIGVLNIKVSLGFNKAFGSTQRGGGERRCCRKQFAYVGRQERCIDRGRDRLTETAKFVYC